MRRISKKHQESINLFLQHWRRYIEIQPYHIAWLNEHAKYTSYTRGECIYDSEWNEEKVFYICQGLLGRVNYYINPKTLKEKRSILSIGLPQMAMLTTDHLYSHTQGTGEIIALRPSVVLTINYNHIKSYMQNDHTLDRIMAALMNKKKRQLARLRQVNVIHDPQSAYIIFSKNLSELVSILSQTEQQDLLGISRSTIRRASYFILTGKIKR